MRENDLVHRALAVHEMHPFAFVKLLTPPGAPF